MNRKEEQNKRKSVEEIRQGKRARIEKEKQEKEKQITNSEVQSAAMNQPGYSRLFLKNA